MNSDALERRFSMSRIKTFAAVAVALGLVASLAYAQGGSSSAPASQPTTQAQKASPAPAKAHTMKHATMAKVDINAASKEELEKLPGVGDATADKIVAARPFKTKAELVSKNIVTKAEYAKISARIVAKQAAAAK